MYSGMNELSVRTRCIFRGSFRIVPHWLGVGLVCAFLRPSPAAQICEHDHHNRNIFCILKRNIALKIETKPRDRKKTFFSQTKELASCAFATRKIGAKKRKNAQKSGTISKTSSAAKPNQSAILRWLRIFPLGGATRPSWDF